MFIIYFQSFQLVTIGIIYNRVNKRSVKFNKNGFLLIFINWFIYYYEFSIKFARIESKQYLQHLNEHKAISTLTFNFQKLDDIYVITVITLSFVKRFTEYY